MTILLLGKSDDDDQQCWPGPKAPTKVVTPYRGFSLHKVTAFFTFCFSDLDFILYCLFVDVLWVYNNDGD